MNNSNMKKDVDTSYNNLVELYNKSDFNNLLISAKRIFVLIFQRISTVIIFWLLLIKILAIPRRH